jgi:sphingolipid delta-4 desaturase
MLPPSSASSVNRGDDGFLWSSLPEPHAARRRAILEAHPEVKKLYGPCPKTKYECTALVFTQLALAYLLREASFWLIVPVAFAIGGIFSQWLLLANHELSHNLAFERPLQNRLFGLFINLPIGVPVVAAFREYHLMHHTHQGVDGIDTDVPTALEARLVKGPLLKLLWLAGQGFAYALRPLFMIPLRPNRWLVANFLVQAVFDALVYYFWGARALAFLPIAALSSMGLHPLAGHYLTEHYVTNEPQETYSYYGPLNALAFNVGYHNEHHDFPYIAGSRLPELKKLAPEFYEPLVSHSSWTAMLWNYVTRRELTPMSRVKRRAQLRGSDAESAAAAIPLDSAL